MEKKMIKTNKIPDKIDLKEFCMDKPLHTFLKKNFNLFGVFKINKKLKKLLDRAKSVTINEKYIMDLLSNYDYNQKKFKIPIDNAKLKINFPF